MPGQFTPQVQAAMTRLGSKMPFGQVLEEIWDSRRIRLSEGTVRHTTYRHGRAADAVNRAEVARLEKEAPAASAQPATLLLSADGAFVPLVNGQWREVKSVAVGEVESQWQAQKGEIVVKTKDISYFSRSYGVREFERLALAELHRRGLENAATVVAVNDGADWIQSFIDYHCPQAVRIIDFAHTRSYLAQAGKAVWGEETASFQVWYQAACHRLKHQPPQQTVANLRLLQRKAKTDEQAAQVDGALFYIQKRLSMIDYAHFRRLHYPIGSGCVESGHKVVAHSRLKGAGMRWAAHHVDPMLSLRNLVCNKRWSQGWQQIVAHHQQRPKASRRTAPAQTPPSPTPLTFAALQAKGLLPSTDSANGTPSIKAKSKRPPKDHPWRRGIWPTKESWRWI